MKILVVKLSSLGDIAQALPAVRRLATRTNAEIDWLVQPEYAPLITALPFISRVITFPRRHFLRGLLPFLSHLRRTRYDAIADLQGLFKSAFAARCARRIPHAICAGPATAREGATRLYNALPPQKTGPRPHSAREMLDVADLLAPPPPSESPLPPLSMRLPPLPVTPPTAASGPRILLAPFSRWPTKNWPLDRFAQLGQRLIAEFGSRIRILGAATNAPAAQSLALAIGPSAFNDCGHFSLLDTCSIIRAADLLIGVDSGPLHWADALGTPLVAIYGATNPTRTGPFHQPTAVITTPTPTPCHPCHKRTCARGDLACLTQLSVDAVFRAALARL